MDAVLVHQLDCIFGGLTPLRLKGQMRHVTSNLGRVTFHDRSPESWESRLFNTNPFMLPVVRMDDRSASVTVHRDQVDSDGVVKSAELGVTWDNRAVIACGEIMTEAKKTENFVRLLAEHQNRVYGYVYSLLGDHTRASDVVQETNLVLWRKIDQFDPEKPFLPWAFAIARFQVLAHLRDQKRDRFLLDPDLAESLSAEAETQAEQLDELREALRPCMQSLTERNRELIEHRYFHAMSIADVAAAVERSVSAVKVALLRVRRQLGQCVQQRMATGIE